VTSSSEWRRIDAALDEILSLPCDEWTAACVRISGQDATLRHELQSLLSKVGGVDPILDFTAASRPAEIQPTVAGLPAGTRIGPFCVVELLGRGGMGEVYRADRADGHFEQQVAIKLMRAEVVDRTRRFHAERQILARLEHPNIAGLHDGGLAEDGRLFMVMELIEGQSITQWCQAHQCALLGRLQLFLAVCDAVSYAHRKLVVHSDLKPNNVFVTKDGEVKLLDFGVARLLDQTPLHETRHGALTPGYAAPEQLTGGQITTATDIYALGVLLFELVTGKNPLGSEELPLAALVGRILEDSPPLASKHAMQQSEAPVPAKSIAGDLDAIIAKAMRKEPEQRYESVAQLKTDILRMLRSEPVFAREGARWYVAGRFLKRHRWSVVAAGVLTLAILGAVGGIGWQGHIAKQEAARALAVKNFLVNVFRASDPRIAADRPRDQITAKELLDGSGRRIEQDFQRQPELQIELMGVVADIYRALGESEPYEALTERRLTLAKADPAIYPGIELATELDRADESASRVDSARHLARADALLRELNLDQSAQRARWWHLRAQELEGAPQSTEARRRALLKAERLYERYAPHDHGRALVLGELSDLDIDADDYENGLRHLLQARDAETTAEDRDDGELSQIWGNIGFAYLNLGDVHGAKSAYGQAMDIAQRTFGVRDVHYWHAAGDVAWITHRGGDRLEAHQLFDHLIELLPDPATQNYQATRVRVSYAGCLESEGQPLAALPLLEAALPVFSRSTEDPHDLNDLRMMLGDVYEQLGRTGEAGLVLQAAHDSEVSLDPPGGNRLLIATERWARFLAAHGEPARAQALFTTVIDNDRGRSLAPRALARAGLSAILLAQGRTHESLETAQAAIRDWQQVHGPRDVRMGPYIERILARALLAAGDLRAAHATARMALEESSVFDAPDAISISDARTLLSLEAATRK